MARRLDTFPERVRRMSKVELEATLFDKPGTEAWEAAAWLAKTRELGGDDSRLGRNLWEALDFLHRSMPNAEYEIVIGILLELRRPDHGEFDGPVY